MAEGGTYDRLLHTALQQGRCHIVAEQMQTLSLIFTLSYSCFAHDF